MIRPNPSEGLVYFDVRYPKAEITSARIILTNIKGATTLLKINADDINDTIEFNLKTTGMYICTLEIDGVKTSTKKLVIIQ